MNLKKMKHEKTKIERIQKINKTKNEKPQLYRNYGMYFVAINECT